AFRCKAPPGYVSCMSTGPPLPADLWDKAWGTHSVIDATASPGERSGRPDGSPFGGERRMREKGSPEGRSDFARAPDPGRGTPTRGPVSPAPAERQGDAAPILRELRPPFTPAAPFPSSGDPRRASLPLNESSRVPAPAPECGPLGRPPREPPN